MDKDLTKLFGKLLPSHPEFAPIIKDIRKKFDIPEIGPEDDGLSEILLSDKNIDWHQVYNDLEESIRTKADILPPETKKLIESVSNFPISPKDLTDFPESQKETQQSMSLMLGQMFTLIASMLAKVEEFYVTFTDLLFEFLITGEARELPFDWLGVAIESEMMGEKVIMAIASEFSDPKDIGRQLTTLHRQRFGKDKPKLTAGNMRTAEYLRMKMADKPIRDIADIYILRNRSQFPNDPNSKTYKEAKRKLHQKLKKDMQRLEEKVDKIIGGDKN